MPFDKVDKCYEIFLCTGIIVLVDIYFSITVLCFSRTLFVHHTINCEAASPTGLMENCQNYRSGAKVETEFGATRVIQGNSFIMLNGMRNCSQTIEFYDNNNSMVDKVYITHNTSNKAVYSKVD